MQLEIILFMCLLVTISLCGSCVQNFVFVIDDPRRKVTTITVKKIGG